MVVLKKNEKNKNKKQEGSRNYVDREIPKKVDPPTADLVIRRP